MNKKSIKSILALVMALTVLFSLCACGSSGTENKTSDGEGQATAADAEGSTISENSKTLRVAIELAYPPFDFKDDAGNPTGVDVDLIKDFGKANGYNVEISDTAWDGLIPALKTGKTDVVISAMSYTPERDEEVDFSDPYALAKIAILASSKTKAETDADFDSEDITIAVKEGTVGAIYADDFFPKATKKRLADESACINEVLQGKADGFIYDELTCTNYNDENPDKTKCISLSKAETGGWCIAVKEGNKELVDELNAFIKDYYQSGKLDELGEKYMPGKKEEFAKNGFQWFFDLEDQYK